ncbi:conserved hypothetical protein [Candidatus Zixiibacteriota bacterium]|nr:conserved hypothetical protein [candidate division Zixibacteria bacterium]
MISKMIKEKLDQYGQGFEDLSSTLQDIPGESWNWKPAPDKWSIHEIIIHVVDSEVHGFIRCRFAIAEPGVTILPYNQEKWTAALNYEKQDTAEYIQLFKYLHATTFKLLKSVGDNSWTNFYMHPERGKMTLESWLDSYNDHLSRHIKQIKRTYNEWKSK